jgi:hypothetical protein
MDISSRIKAANISPNSSLWKTLQQYASQRCNSWTSSLLLHASTGGFYEKPYITLVLKIHKKLRETRKLKSIHE